MDLSDNRSGGINMTRIRQLSPDQAFQLINSKMGSDIGKPGFRAEDIKRYLRNMASADYRYYSGAKSRFYNGDPAVLVAYGMNECRTEASSPNFETCIFQAIENFFNEWILFAVGAYLYGYQTTEDYSRLVASITAQTIGPVDIMLDNVEYPTSQNKDLWVRASSIVWMDIVNR